MYHLKALPFLCDTYVPDTSSTAKLCSFEEVGEIYLKKRGEKNSVQNVAAVPTITISSVLEPLDAPFHIYGEFCQRTNILSQNF